MTPGGNILWSCDADVNEQVVSKSSRNSFPKVVELLGVMRTWGPSLPATDGEEARLYRKVTSPCFNDSTHECVWRYGIAKVTGMLKQEWRPQGSVNGRILDLVEDCKAWVSGVSTSSLLER